jgi:hypothetical protein
MSLHNEGSYYDAHEAWEELWIDETDDEVRLFLQGLIQVTSAFHKVFFQRQPVGCSRAGSRSSHRIRTNTWVLPSACSERRRGPVPPLSRAGRASVRTRSQSYYGRRVVRAENRFP